MKKVLSVAMASAMVLGMGANAFAIKYNVDSNDTAKWPKNFKFEGALFVTDKDGDLVKNATTNINRNSKVDFQPGDVVWMPLFADDQIVYDSVLEEGTEGKDGILNVKAEANINVDHAGEYFERKSDGYLINVKDNSIFPTVDANTVKIDTGKTTDNGEKIYKVAKVTVSDVKPVKEYADRTMVANSTRYFIGATEYRNEAEFKTALTEQGSNAGAFLTVDIKSIASTDDKVGDAVVGGKVVAHGPYTGNIDKNWSINLIEEKGSTMTDFVEKAELYKADEVDYHSYKANADIHPNDVFVKVTLKKEWKNCDVKNVKYYVYVADNSGKQTNKVYVEGKYAAPKAKTVDFTWSNDASVASLWKAEENGVAVFDFQDKAFFTVKMYKGECLYLDLDAAYKLATAKEFDGDIDSFYYFDKENANFFREGELVIVSDNDELNVYEVTEDGAEQVEADYVKGHAVAHTNQKVNGYVFNTKELGNYILAEGVEEDEIVDEEEDDEVEAPEVEEEAEAPAKPNPDTGANDFVGLAVSLAVVSVAAAGALALKK